MIRKIKFYFYLLCYLQCLAENNTDEVVRRYLRRKVNKYDSKRNIQSPR